MSRIDGTEADLTPEAVRAVLHARALALAAKPLGADGDAHVDVLEFALARERYALEPKWVQEVAILPELAPLPGVPPFVLGLINLRGRILAVIDIKRFFNLPQEGISNLNRVIVLRHGAMVFGLLADDIVGQRRLARSALRAPQSCVCGIHSDYLLGVTPERLIVLDAQKILQDRTLIVRQEAK